MNNEKLREYLNLQWTYRIETAKDENNKTYYVVYVEELPGIATDAETVAEAMELIKDAMLGVFKLYIKQGEELPLPVNKEKYKGKILYRTTPNRHFKISREAKKRNISLSEVLDAFVDNSIAKK